MSRISTQLLLDQDTTVTCPKCATEFSLDHGFAKKALEQLSEASDGAIAAMRKAERAEVQKLAKQLASDQAQAAKGEIENLRNLMAEQAAAHTRAIAEVRNLTEKSYAPRFAEMRQALDERDGQLKALRAREDSLSTREKDLEATVNAAAQTKAVEMVAAERTAFAQQLAERDTQVADAEGRTAAIAQRAGAAQG